VVTDINKIFRDNEEIFIDLKGQKLLRQYRNYEINLCDAFVFANFAVINSALRASVSSRYVTIMHIAGTDDINTITFKFKH